MTAWAPEPAELAAVRAAWERLVAHATPRGMAPIDLFVDVVVVHGMLRDLADAGAPAVAVAWPRLESETAALVAAVEGLVAGAVWPGADLERLPLHARRDLLAAAGGFVAPRHAPALARALEDAGVVPAGDRLAALLARVNDGALAVRLLDRLCHTPGAEGAWLQSLAAARFALHDEGRAAPPAIERPFAEALASTGALAEPERLELRLRWAARQDAVAALDELADAVADRGASDVPDGLLAVLARAARRDPDAAERFVGGLEWLADRALALAALARASEVEMPRLVERAFGLADDLVAAQHPAEADARTAWDVSSALLEIAAGLGHAPLATRAMQAAGPPLCGAFLATWTALRRRALRDGRADPAFLDALRPSSPGRAAARAHVCGPLSSLADHVLLAWLRIKTLPLPALPWWSAREAGLP